MGGYSKLDGIRMLAEARIHLCEKCGDVGCAQFFHIRQVKYRIDMTRQS